MRRIRTAQLQIFGLQLVIIEVAISYHRRCHGRPSRCISISLENTQVNGCKCSLRAWPHSTIKKFPLADSSWYARKPSNVFDSKPDLHLFSPKYSNFVGQDLPCHSRVAATIRKSKQKRKRSLAPGKPQGRPQTTYSHSGCSKWINGANFGIQT
ncbi:hypothetical protein IWZ01DRAFT_501983 [Phyllosticta capitalensis]